MGLCRSRLGEMAPYSRLRVVQFLSSLGLLGVAVVLPVGSILSSCSAPPAHCALGACTVAAPLPSVHRRMPSEWHSLRIVDCPEAGHLGARSLGPKQLHTPQNSKWEYGIPKGNRRLEIEFGRSPVMAISTRFMRIQMHPHDRACMHDQNRPKNCRS